MAELKTPEREIELVKGTSEKKAIVNNPPRENYTNTPNLNAVKGLADAVGVEQLAEKVVGSEYIVVEPTERGDKVVVELDHTNLETEEPKEDSEKLITSGAVFDALANAGGVAINIQTSGTTIVTDPSELIEGKEYTINIPVGYNPYNVDAQTAYLHECSLYLPVTKVDGIDYPPEVNQYGTFGYQLYKYIGGHYPGNIEDIFKISVAGPGGTMTDISQGVNHTFTYGGLGTYNNNFNDFADEVLGFISYSGFVTSGTLTDDQFEKLTSNDGNYILADNKKFEYAGTVDGVMHYSCSLHNIVYCMDVTITTKEWEYTSTRNIEYEKAIKYLVSSELALADFEHEVGTTNTVIVIKPGVLEPEAIYDIALEIEGTGVHYGVSFITFPDNGSQCITTSLLTVNGSTEECYATMLSTGQVNLTIPYVMSPQSETTHIYIRKR